MIMIIIYCLNVNDYFVKKTKTSKTRISNAKEPKNSIIYNTNAVF